MNVGNMPVTQERHDPADRPLRFVPVGGANQADTVVQTTVGPLVAAGAVTKFAGVGNDDYGFRPDAAPPDTNGAVGATQYVQWVNESFAVFDKAGQLKFGPVPGSSLFANLGGA